MFGDREQQTVLAELNGKTGEILTRDDVADERFRDILELDETTGSLTITNTRTAHTGVYKLEIRSSSGDSEQTFIVTVREKVEQKLLKGGESVTLKPDTEIQRDDLILWMFGDQDKLIAQIRGGTGETYDDVNKRLRDRLKLDKKTGSLTITKIEAEHTGLYKLQIISSRGTLVKRFKVLIQQRDVVVAAGDICFVYTRVLTEIQSDEMRSNLLYQPETPCLLVSQGGLPTKPGAENDSLILSALSSFTLLTCSAVLCSGFLSILLPRFDQRLRLYPTLSTSQGIVLSLPVGAVPRLSTSVL
ncbi:uncharacterized protein LOC109053785 [Cyprinus carpio]|uniref:Uncharacterized protein LOC109053785 n=1 Tax=Cyprinus carpio TaxID=7962 RepID=A0A9R0AVN3_CYPCA|nr:uncharacterized protein LOC109053785 [Cyprinus carpio]